MWVGSEYISDTERLIEEEIAPLVGSRGDSYDDPLAETIGGLYKMGEFHVSRPWRSAEEVEGVRLEWVDGLDHRQLIDPRGTMPVSEYDELYHERTQSSVKEGWVQLAESPNNRRSSSPSDAVVGGACAPGRLNAPTTLRLVCGGCAILSCAVRPSLMGLFAGPRLLLRECQERWR